MARFCLRFIDGFMPSIKSNVKIAHIQNADSGLLKPHCQWSRTLTIEYSESQKDS